MACGAFGSFMLGQDYTRGGCSSKSLSWQQQLRCIVCCSATIVKRGPTHGQRLITIWSSASREVFSKWSAVRVKELVGDVSENGRRRGVTRPWVTRTRRRVRNCRRSARTPDPESSGRRSAERSSESLGDCRPEAPAALKRKW